MKRILTTLLLFIVWIAWEQVVSEPATYNTVSAQTSVDRSYQQQTDCFTFDFRYLELENALYSPVSRHIEIFIDEKAFSEENLKTLFIYLSKKNPEPNKLTVVVHTNWAQLWYPSDCPPSASSGRPDPPDKYDYLQATYSRREKVEYFRYSPAVKVHDADFKMVIIKGKRKSSNE